MECLVVALGEKKEVVTQAGLSKEAGVGSLTSEGQATWPIVPQFRFHLEEVV